MAETKFPTEMVNLPSKGWFYDSANPLASGEVEVKYMTAKEEDILTSQNLIRKGIVFDKLLNALVVSKIKLDDMLIGDKNAVLIAARVLAYGKNYEFDYRETDNRANSLPINQQNRGILTHDVIGYLPYWEYSQYPDFNYELLSEMNFFSAELASNGDIINSHNWENLSIKLLQVKKYLMSLFLLEDKNWTSVILILFKVFLIKIHLI